jgi:hypothetical protein
MMYFNYTFLTKMFRPLYCDHLQCEIIKMIRGICILVIISPRRWPQERSKYVGKLSVIKYIIKIEVYFVGYLYIMDLIYCTEDGTY